MYSEKTYKNYIFWVQVKRVFLIILFSCIGSAIGALIGSILKSTIQISTYNTWIVIVSTLIFFAISILLTANTGKEVQDGYWKIAVLRKLTVLQKELELNNELLEKSQKTLEKRKSVPTQSLQKREFAKPVEVSKKEKISVSVPQEVSEK
jgi:uncharacterized protein YacL